MRGMCWAVHRAYAASPHCLQAMKWMEHMHTGRVHGTLHGYQKVTPPSEFTNSSGMRTRRP